MKAALSHILLPFSCLWLLNQTLRSQAVPVQVVQESDTTWTLLRNGEPYYIKGAGTTNMDFFPELAARGGNSIRTWGVDAWTRTVLNEARENGLTVMLGLWMKKETDGFDYDDAEKVNQQLENFRNYVRQFKDHPALLAWSIGNEVDLNYSNLNVWNAVNDISGMIHQEDGNHPTLTITAGISANKANAIAERAPDLDMLGINVYGGIGSVRSTLKASDWSKPYVITEWGVNGPWESLKTLWGAPLELTSTEKATLFLNRYDAFIKPYSASVPGSYAFYWNSKWEGTETWFGLWVADETTPMIDALQYSWTSEWADNRAPDIHSVLLNSKEAGSSLFIHSMKQNLVEVEATDPENDPLTYEYLVLPEKEGGFPVEEVQGATFPTITGLTIEQDENSAQLQFEAGHNLKQFRLYVLVRDGKNHVATASFPFLTSFVFTGSRGTNPDPESPVRIYPNPVHDLLHIHTGTLTGPLTARIFSAFGKEFVSFTLPAQKENGEISVSHLPPGVYILQLTGDAGSSLVHYFLKY